MEKEIILKSAEIYNKYVEQLLTLYKLKKAKEKIGRK